MKVECILSTFAKRDTLENLYGLNKKESVNQQKFRTRMNEINSPVKNVPEIGNTRKIMIADRLRIRTSPSKKMRRRLAERDFRMIAIINQLSFLANI